jgi:hypothetical protein
MPNTKRYFMPAMDGLSWEAYVQRAKDSIRDVKHPVLKEIVDSLPDEVREQVFNEIDQDIDVWKTNKELTEGWRIL